MMTERKKLSLGSVADRASDDTRSAERSWNVSPARAAALKERARDMRRNPTEAQKALWERLSDKQCGFTFNRGVVMGSAIADFACKTRWLVVETGGTDDDAAGTLAKLSDRKMKDVGVRVMRFSEAEVLEDIETVVKAIKDELQQPFDKNDPRRSALPNEDNDEANGPVEANAQD
jgi:very-short-patch-repair endonuclease